jgi:hypothetical protein
MIEYTKEEKISILKEMLFNPKKKRTKKIKIAKMLKLMKINLN